MTQPRPSLVMAAYDEEEGRADDGSIDGTAPAVRAFTKHFRGSVVAAGALEPV